MNWTFILFDNCINSYCPGLDLIRVYEDRERSDWPFVLEFGRKEERSKEASIIIACDGPDRQKAFNRICESCIHHPGVIDFSGIYVDPKEVEERIQ